MKKHDSLDLEAVRRVLAATPHPLTLDDILRRTGLSRRVKRDIIAALHRMADEGELVRLRGGSWTPAARLKTVTGTIAVQRSGAAFVTPDGHDRHSPQDIFIAPDALGDAWNGDTVEVTLLPARRGSGTEGRVLRVLNRGETALTVRVLRPARSASRVVARPVDSRLNFDVLADASALPEPPQRGELLRVAIGERLLSPTDEPLWSATATASLGREDDVSVQEQLTKLNHLIPTDFPDDVRAEAEAAARRDLAAEPYVDVRDLALVTIDGDDARDFDDAVYVERQGDGWRLAVAIADVSLYVRPRGKLDREARERGNSYYFPASVEPMLPEALSNGVCSLRPGEDRRVMVADLRLDAGGHTRGMKFYAGLMRSRARLTYTGVQALLDGGDNSALGQHAPGVPAMLDAAAQLAALLILRRQKRDGLELDIPEAEFVVENGHVIAVRNRQRLFSHRLIEAFMVTANEAVATFLTEKHAPFLYRVHPAPSQEKMENLVRSLRATDLTAPMPRMKSGQFTPEAAARWLHVVLDMATGTDQSFLINRLVLRSMMQARYDPEPGVHFGLASPCYCHFTSPIRRYADLATHRALRHALGLETGGPIPTGHKLLAVAETCNSREHAAQDAEREITRRLGCLLLRDRIGETFQGVISGVISFGLFVELRTMPLEGMVRVESLGRDYFVYDADRQELRGERTGQAYRLGEPVEVRLADVHVGRLEITLTLTDNSLPERDGSMPRPARAAAREEGERRRGGARRPAGRTNKTSKRNGTPSQTASGRRAPRPPARRKRGR